MNVAELIELLKGQPPERRVVLRVSPAECCRTRFHLAIDCMKARSSPGSAAVQTGSSPGSGCTWPNSIICRGANPDGTPTFSLRRQRISLIMRVLSTAARPARMWP